MSLTREQALSRVREHVGDALSSFGLSECRMRQILAGLVPMPEWLLEAVGLRRVVGSPVADALPSPAAQGH